VQDAILMAKRTESRTPCGYLGAVVGDGIGVVDVDRREDGAIYGPWTPVTARY
jgi:hypothetical protein